MKIKKAFACLASGTALAMLAVSGTAVADEAGTTYKFGGYAKFDAMFTDYSSANTPSGNSLMRQFYYTPQIPLDIPNVSANDVTADFQARETRINFRADTKTEGGDSITAFIEMDFFTDPDGNEVVSNSYKPRLRHAFLKYNNWTFGQTWSTFQDVGALPEALDFVGPAESTTFIRQAMVRYTTGNLELAVENPQTFVSGGTRDLSTMPDLIGRYTFKVGDGYVKVAGLVRSLKIQDTGSGSQADETAYGVSLSTKIPFGNGADFRAMVTVGDGVGRYVGLGFVPDGYVDPAGSIKTTDLVAAFAAVRVPFSNGWRANVMYGMTDIGYDNDALATGLNEKGASFHVNVIKNILPKLDAGAELIWGEREVIGGGKGDFTRVQFSAKYAF